MRFGAQVKQAGGLGAALARAEAMGAEVMQVFAQSPRQWRYPEANAERAAAFGQRWPASPVVRQVVTHAPYLVNVASVDPSLYQRSVQCLADNLRATCAMGALGLVVHLGSHLGAGLEARLDRVADGLRRALDGCGAGEAARLLLENTAGAGGTIGRTFEELAAVIDRTGGDPRLGVCLDTQHLWASGVPFSTVTAANRVVRGIDRTVGRGRLWCLHVNDSKTALGAGVDRHESLGKGMIGEDGFRALLGHPRLQRLPAVLEVPGFEGHGPAAADLEAARRLHEEGLALREAASVIRYAEPNDGEVVGRVYVEAWRAGCRGLLPDEYLAGVEPAAGPGGGTVLVVESDEAVAGLATLGPARDEPGGEAGEVPQLAVAPDHWGRGLGRRLLDAAAEELRWAGFSEAVAWVLETNRRARRCFEGAGWEADGGERADLDRGVVLRQVRYRRPLPFSPFALRFDTAGPDDIDDLLVLSDDLARWMIDNGIEQWRPGEVPAGRIRHFVVDGEVTLLRSGDQIVASVGVTWEDPFAWNDSVGVAGYVHQLMVARPYAGQGLGRRLLQRAEGRIVDGGHRRVRLDCVTTNDALRRYYERAGYRHVGETDFGGRADLRPCALYEKRVTTPPAARA